MRLDGNVLATTVCVCGKTCDAAGKTVVAPHGGIECNFHTLCNNKQKGNRCRCRR